MDPSNAQDLARAASIQVRGISEEELPTFLQTMSVPYGFDPSPERVARLQKNFELSRLRAAFDGQRVVATFGSFGLKMTVPGGVLPAAGTSVVSVVPTHRRRGVLRAMMAEHLADARGTTGFYASTPTRMAKPPVSASMTMPRSS
ncbi:MAG: GNAT family N-acetyltransferase [Planctomycetes bacterium]|nr:GNAT family N-acetyltransferase [Planctomycetota bacterium]